MKKLGKIDWGVTPYQDISTASIMRCSQIKTGMIFDVADDKTPWKVIREGNYNLVDGKRKRIENIFKNKWWCQVEDQSLPEMLCCFDLIFDNAETNKFRWPKK